MSKKVLLLVGDFMEGMEAYFAMHALQMHGHEAVAVCPGVAAGGSVATAVHDFEAEQTYSEKRGHRFPVHAEFDGVDVAEYDALFVPGGRAPEYLRLEPRVLEIVRQFHAASKPIASLCHGPQLLLTAGVLEGVHCTAYKAIRPDLVMGGALFHEVPNTQAVRHGHVVTGVDWVSNPAVLRALLGLLGASPAPDETSNGIKVNVFE